MLRDVPAEIRADVEYTFVVKEAAAPAILKAAFESSGFRSFEDPKRAVERCKAEQKF
jgi:hypothetical protein